MMRRDADRTVSRIDEETVSIGYRARESDSGPDGSSRIIDSLTVGGLLDLLPVEARLREELCDPRRLFWFANGYQSWSPGWELGGLARNPNLRLVKILSRYTHRDRQRIGRAELAAHGFAYLRSGEHYLALFSRNRGGPPVTLRIDRRRMRMAVELHSDGASFERGEELAELLLFHRKGYFAFADAVAALYRGLTAMSRAEALAAPSSQGANRRLAVGGWCSWYRYYTRVDETAIAGDLAGLAATPNLVRALFVERDRPTVFQIDDGWQRAVGDWEAHPQRFPGGMRRQAEAIAASGFIPGLWVAPFAVAPGARIVRERPEWLLRDEGGRLVRAGYNPNWEGIFYCLDLSRPEVRAYLRELFAKFIDEWGFRYLKLDFLYAGMLNGSHAVSGGAYRWYREALDPIVSVERTQRGEPVVFLGCGAPLESSLPLFGLMRIGADTKEAWDELDVRLIAHMGRPAAHINLRDTIGRAFMNRTLTYADPDVIFLRSRRTSLTRSEKELIAGVGMMFGSQLMTSDGYASFDDPREIELTRWAIALAELLGEREWGTLMLARDLWRCFSRDGEISGLINLRSRRVRIAAADAARWGLHGARLPPSSPRRPRSAATGAVAANAGEAGADVVVAPHSLALWRSGARGDRSTG